MEGKEGMSFSLRLESMNYYFLISVLAISRKASR